MSRNYTDIDVLYELSTIDVTDDLFSVIHFVGRYEPRVKPRRGIDTTPRPFVWTKAQRKDPGA